MRSGIQGRKRKPCRVALDSGFDAEPVIGPRIARTRWHRPGMTKNIDFATDKDYIPLRPFVSGAFLEAILKRNGRRRFCLRARNAKSGADTGHRPARLDSPAGSSADGEAAATGAIRMRPTGGAPPPHEKRGPYSHKRRKQERRKATHSQGVRDKTRCAFRRSAPRSNNPAEARDRIMLFENARDYPRGAGGSGRSNVNG